MSKVILGQRNIQELEAAKFLPDNTVYYAAPLDFHLTYDKQTKAHKERRTDSRLSWLNSACGAVKDCNVIMLDPDNGLEIKTYPNLNQSKSGKYAYYSEVKKLFSDKAICVIYHHLNRTGSHQSQIQNRADELKQRVASKGSVFCIRFAPYSPRAYLILSKAREAKDIRANLEIFMNSPCGIGWDSYYEV